MAQTDVTGRAGNVIALTSPYISGDEVREAQMLLRSGGYLKSVAPNGVFGDETAEACEEAGRVLGLHPKRVKPLWTPELGRLLEGGKPTPAQERRAEKRARQATATIGSGGLEFVLDRVGETEVAGKPSNTCPVCDEWGYRGPWCCMLWALAMEHGGSEMISSVADHGWDPDPRWHSCPDLLNDARARRFGVRVVKEPRHGDGVLFDWEQPKLGRGRSVVDHIGLFRDFTGSARSEIKTVEGNTSAQGDVTGSQSNGGGIFKRRRDVNIVAAYVRCTR